MPKLDGRIDAYIQKQQPFAQPILRHLRELIHDACPECEETLKWGMPYFMHHGLLCGFAAFKEHAVFGLWKGKLLLGPDHRSSDAMGSFGRLTQVRDLPPRRQLIALLRRATKLNEDGVKAPVRKAATRPAIRMPAELRAALGANARALATYEKLPPSHRREYLEWITEAKREETRQRRIAQAITWMAAGKSRNWKYERAR